MDGKPFPSGYPASASNRFASFNVFVQLRAAGVARRAGRRETERRQLTAPRDVLDEALAVDRQRQRAADPLVVERRLGDVDPIKIRAEVRFDLQQVWDNVPCRNRSSTAAIVSVM